MKITPLTIDFDVTNAQEVEFVNELMNRLSGSAPLKAMAAPTEIPVTSTSVPTFNEPTIEPEPVQAPAKDEKTPEKASNEPLTAKDMQAFMIDLMKSGKITRPQLTDIMLEFGGASLMRIKPEKYELLKQRIETYND